MRTTSPLRETDTNALCIARIQACGVQMKRSDFAVQHPQHGQIYPDAVGVKVESDCESFVIFEGERRLSPQLVSEILRWRGWAQYLVCGFITPKQVRDTHIRRRAILHRNGIILAQIADGLVSLGDISFHTALMVDPDKVAILSKAYYSHDGSMDAPSGSSAARRMTATRGEWDALRRYLLPGPAPMVDIHADLPQYRKYTARALRVLIDKDEAPGLAYEGHARTLFRRST